MMKNKIKKVNIIILIGAGLRFFMGFFAKPNINQHDIINQSYGHFDYACHFFKTFVLPDSNKYEFHQPPLNALIQGVVMRFVSIFNNSHKGFQTAYRHFMTDMSLASKLKSKELYNYLMNLYSYNKFLSILYSILILIIIYKILKLLFDDWKKVLIGTIICALYPGMVFMATQYSNDGLSYMFFFLSLYLAIKWFKNNDIKTIIALAISIGLGMMTKISVGAVAFIIAPMMLYRLFTTNDSNVNVSSIDEKKIKFSFNTKIFKELIVFAIIVFPLGLLFPIRSLVVFNQPLGYVPEIAKGTYMEINKNTYGIVERFLTYPISRIMVDKYGIYHDMKEYNVWIDLIKTATYDEFNHTKTFMHNINYVLYFLNIIFYFATFILFIISLIKLPKKICMCKGSSNDKNNILPIYIIMALYIVAITMYIFFNYKYQYSCNSNYRYVMYITLAQTLLILK